MFKLGFTAISALILSSVSLGGDNFYFDSPGKDSTGFVNTQSQLERSYEKYPQEKIWYQYGRPYWRTDVKPLAKAVKVEKPQVVDEVKVAAAAPARFSFVGKVYFGNDKAGLSPREKARLEEFAAKVKEGIDENSKIEIRGYASNNGEDQYNLSLSDKRAERVKAFLESKGVPSANIQTLAFGEAVNNGLSDSESRRVEFTVR